jgi:hypothetical protein
MYDDSMGNIPSQLDLAVMACGHMGGWSRGYGSGILVLDSDILRFVVKPLKYI